MIDYVSTIKNKILNCPKGKSFKSILSDDEISFIEDYTKNIRDISFTTRIFYTINNIDDYIKCYKCGKAVIKNISPIKYNKNKENELNLNFSTLCCSCNPNSTCKQNYTTRYKKFADREQDEYLKSRILDVKENFYDDEFINNWAIKFKLENGHKPTKEDFRQFFGRKFPRKSLERKFDLSLFNLWDSFLELKVCDYLNSLGYVEKNTVFDCTSNVDYVRNSMFSLDKLKYYQLDIYIPKLNLAFEVQDFTTHDKNSDTVPYKQRKNQYKHGPSYHEDKRNKARAIGIYVIDLWEDEIRNLSFEGIIDKCLIQII